MHIYVNAIYNAVTMNLIFEKVPAECRTTEISDRHSVSLDSSYSRPEFIRRRCLQSARHEIYEISQPIFEVLFERNAWNVRCF